MSETRVPKGKGKKNFFQVGDTVKFVDGRRTSLNWKLPAGFNTYEVVWVSKSSWDSFDRIALRPTKGSNNLRRSTWARTRNIGNREYPEVASNALELTNAVGAYPIY